MKFNESQLARLADIGVVDLTRGHGKRFVDTLSIMVESAWLDACDNSERGGTAQGDSTQRDARGETSFDALWSRLVDACIDKQIESMKCDGFSKVEGWYAFLDRELSTFGLDQTGGPIAGALR